MDTKHFKLLVLLAILIIQNGCAELPVKEQLHPSVSETTLRKEYHEALKDAAIVEDDDIDDNLLAITRDNPNLIWNKDKTRLLVVAWKSMCSYQKYIKNGTQTLNDPDKALWVTAAPQVKTFCHDYLLKSPKATDEQLNLRLKQYLGLPSTGEYGVFVELWVRPEEIFRPCVDPEITDKKCNPEIPNCFPPVANIPDYGVFYQNLYFKSFRNSDRYPWTGMGYTYDWGNQKSKFGASEFILVPNTSYQIKQAVATGEYCK